MNLIASGESVTIPRVFLGLLVRRLPGGAALQSLSRGRQAGSLLAAIAVTGLGLTESHAQPEGLRLQPMIVRTVQPQHSIRHEVQIRSPLDAARWQPMLKGPSHHSHALNANSGGPEEEARFNWYALSETTDRPARTVSIALEGFTPQRVEFEVGRALYFLSTAVELADGEPKSAPKELGNLVAYEIGNQPVFEKRVETELTIRSEKARTSLGRPILICLPAEEWHHDEYHGIHDAEFCLIVFQTEPYGTRDESRTGTLDQFGLNSLLLEKAELVGISARNLSPIDSPPRKIKSLE